MTIRDVKCAICNEQMYYNGEPEHEPEFTLIVERHHEYVYDWFVHERCFKALHLKPEVDLST